MSFNYIQPTELVVGPKKIEEVANLIKRYGNKVLFIGPELNDAIKPMFDRIENILKVDAVEYVSYFAVEPNPSTTTVNEALKLANKNNVDAILAVGGGSTIDTAKVVGLFYKQEEINWTETFKNYDSFSARYPKISDNQIPVIAVSTTAGTGSQCTQASVITDAESKMKLTIFHQDNYCKVAIIDPELCLTLPKFITVSTAFDAFSHAFEAYLRNDENPIAEMLSLDAIKSIVEYLPKVLVDNTVENRLKLSVADTYGGIALANCGACLPHPLSEIIGSMVGRLSHGQALAMVYPTFVKHVADKYQTKFAKVCRIFDESYNGKSDEVAAKEFYLVLENFLKANDLVFNLKDYTTDKAVINDIINCPVWNFLPMEKTEVIKTIVKEICA